MHCNLLTTLAVPICAPGPATAPTAPLVTVTSPFVFTVRTRWKTATFKLNYFPICKKIMILFELHDYEKHVFFMVTTNHFRQVYKVYHERHPPCQQN